MRHLLSGRRAGLLAAVAAATPLGSAAAVPAPAAAGLQHSTRVASARSAPRVDFTCQSPDVCVFPNDDYTGTYGRPWFGPAQLNPAIYSGPPWVTFATWAITPNPGSLTNASDSCVWVYDAATGYVDYVLPHSQLDLDHSDGWLFIQYGVHNCGSEPFPLPS
jgi:hypothetical protein